MSGHEVYLAFAWIDAMLKANATFVAQMTGGIWRGYVPPATVPPYCIFGFQAGTDVVTMNGFRIIVDGLFQVKVSGPVDGLATLVAAAQQLDTLIGLPPTSGAVIIGGVTVGQVLSCYRTSPIASEEIVNDEPWSTIGGLYRIIVEQR